ncbi:MAG: 3-oxoacyl-[acyl-carrier-protein] reductase [Candidatus Latescibacteria bacterium]|nr:3-oxoacyl-[acyl-carrier-protein] reductase [Candidatus Latescibacterota bacterium]NIM20978.1 3-oxoacyl-[acyl-carrier-protein] reductase [Candidatus Latescibacterota bacterium]NIM65113.1 3-oxoacyl-[acyl-carrier-protein] reductase [Candidatus Latescibacterota bacterium]NIO01628.1 3-oxoacyl-[acyl-carrier-protein] reductase [Candidatus Latescibacterota bacterium]NIO28145.1 3-oxoacyl-[acyl-carrier-protein] reductase [Candidatus Latescibacterota bacterium]
MDFKNRTAVVTGAARGIGRDIAIKLAERGANVALIDLEIAGAEETAKECETHGIQAKAYKCDVSSFEDVDGVGKQVLSEFDAVDFLINNAGVVRDRLLLRMTPEDWNFVISVNLTGTFNCCKVLSPHMLKRRQGRIVNVASVIGIMGNAGQANYAASKAGIIGLTKTLAKEFASRGVTVNAVAPGFIDTAMTESLSADIRESMMKMIPLGRFGKGEDVANVALFLLSDMASYITGQVLNCDGGMIMAR